MSGYPKFNQKSIDWLSSLPDDEVAKMAQLYDKYLGEVNASKSRDPSRTYAYDGKVPLIGRQSTQNRRFFDEVVAPNYPQRGPTTTGVPALSIEDIYAEYANRQHKAKAATPQEPRLSQPTNNQTPVFGKEWMSAEKAKEADLNERLRKSKLALTKANIRSLPKEEYVPTIEEAKKIKENQLKESNLAAKKAAEQAAKTPIAARQLPTTIRATMPDGSSYVQRGSSSPVQDIQGWWTNPDMLARANKSTEASRLAGRPNVAENEAKDMIRQFWASNPELHKNLLDYRTKNREFDVRRFESEQEVRRQQIASEGGVRQAEIIRGQSDFDQFTKYAADMATNGNYREAQQASRLAKIYEIQQKADQEKNDEAHGVAVEAFQRLLKGELAELKDANPNMPDYNVSDYAKSISRILKIKGSGDTIRKKLAEGQTLKQILDRVDSLPQQR